MAKGKKKLWSYNTGHKGINWVRVYERSQSPKSLYIEWYWEGRRWQRALRTVMGHPVTDHRIAMNLADNMAATLEQRHNDKAFVKFRAPQEVTSENEIASLGETVEKYHAAKEGVWSDHHRKSMERRRAFWLAHLGADTPLTHISPAMVEGDSTKRKTLMYMRGLYTWAIRKARILPLSYDLSGLEVPAVTKGGLSYTVHEIRSLLDALEQECPEAAWMGHVAWQTGRRSGAILAVQPEDVVLFDDYALISFKKEHDKSKKPGEAAVSGRGLELTRILLADERDTMTGAKSDTALRGWLYRAEERAGIDRIKGRGWHSFKRAFATAADNMGAASKQSGTRRETLTGIYEQDWVAPKVELAAKLEEIVSSHRTGSGT
jgi:hypothetical protein